MAMEFALCLRQLATIALGQDAMLMMGDLDTLCAHYHIDTKGRHSALGDAEISTKLFYAMLDDLHANYHNLWGGSALSRNLINSALPQQEQAGLTLPHLNKPPLPQQA